MDINMISKKALPHHLIITLACFLTCLQLKWLCLSVITH